MNNITADTVVRAVFWDMDGTLIDSEQIHFEVIRDWCAGYGVTLTKEDNENLQAKAMAEKWRLVAPRLPETADEETFRRQCKEWYIERITPDAGIPQTGAVVRELAKRGVIQGCVSNGETAVVRANVETLGLQDAFAFLVSGQDVKHGKPAPDPYLLAAERAGFKPGECLVVEDSRLGQKAARDAGCLVCGLINPSNPDPDTDFRMTTFDDFPFGLLG